MKLFIVGKYIDKTLWEFCGVFDKKDKAEFACLTPNHFVGPAFLNRCLPSNVSNWPEAYYPKA